MEEAGGGQGITMSRDALLHMSWGMSTIELRSLCRTERAMRRICAEYIYPIRLNQLVEWASKSGVPKWHEAMTRVETLTQNPLWRLYLYHMFIILTTAEKKLGTLWTKPYPSDESRITVAKKWAPAYYGDPVAPLYVIDLSEIKRYEGSSVLLRKDRSRLRSTLWWSARLTHKNLEQDFQTGVFETVTFLGSGPKGSRSTFMRGGRERIMRSDMMDGLMFMLRSGYEPTHWRSRRPIDLKLWMVPAPEISPARIPSDPRLQAPICFSCGEEAVKQCSGCKKVYYCSQECCVRGWRELGHSLECGK